MNAAVDMRRLIYTTIRELLDNARGMSAARLRPLLQETLSALRTLKTTWAEFSVEEAMSGLDLMQLWLDQPFARGVAEDAARRGVIYDLVELSKICQRFPSSLYTHGVEIGPVRDPSRLGGFADVFEGVHYGRAVALKRLRVYGLANEHLEMHKSLAHEALVWRQLQHPSILPFLGIDSATFAETGYLCLVSPWMERGTLKGYMNNGEYEPERDLLRILAEVAEGLEYFHVQKVVHGDIKEANILIDDNRHVKLCDFGLVVVGDLTAGRLSTTVHGHGTGSWMSPERILGDTGDHRRAPPDDVFAFGCLIYYMLSGSAPFETLVQVRAAMCIAKGQRPPKPSPYGAAAIRNVQDALWAIAEDCWKQEANDRPTIAVARVRLECTCPRAPFPAVTPLGTSHSSVPPIMPQHPTPVSDTSARTEPCLPMEELWTTVMPARPIIAPTVTPADLSPSNGSAAASALKSATTPFPGPFFVNDCDLPVPQSVSAPAVPDSIPRPMINVAGWKSTILSRFSSISTDTASTLVGSPTRLPTAPLFAGYHARRFSKSKW